LLLPAVAHSAPNEPASTDKTDLPRWNVRTDALMVAMPQEKLLPLLPDLRDPGKIDAAVEKLLAAIQRKEAILTGCLMLFTLDGARGESRAITELLYPDDYGGPQAPQTVMDPANAPANRWTGVPNPSSFTTMNLGPFLAVEPHVSANGNSIRLEFEVQRATLLGFDVYDSALAKIEMPRRFCSKNSGQISLQNGQRSLIGVHVLTKPKGYLEVFILQSSATPLP